MIELDDKVKAVLDLNVEFFQNADLASITLEWMGTNPTNRLYVYCISGLGPPAGDKWLYFRLKCVLYIEGLYDQIKVTKLKGKRIVLTINY